MPHRLAKHGGPPRLPSTVMVVYAADSVLNQDQVHQAKFQAGFFPAAGASLTPRRRVHPGSHSQLGVRVGKQ